MVPTIWVEMDHFPQTSTGKISRLKLPSPDLSQLSTAEYVAPRNIVEEQLVTIWTSLLPVDRVGVEDNFFKIGGHSLLAMRVIAAIRKEMYREPQVADLFNYPTIAELAKYLTEAAPSDILPPITAGPRPERIPLSYGQERIWFVDQFEGSVQYHLPTVLRLQRNLEVEVLSQALKALVERHEVLRTQIRSEAGASFQVVQSAAGWEMAFSEFSETESNERLQDKIVAIVSEPFDLSNDYLLRAHLIRCGEADHVLVLVIHHIASDGWSNSILIKDLVHFFQAASAREEPTLPPLPIQYADYAIWQRQHFTGDYLEAQLDWWENELRGVETLDIPTDYPRP